MKLLVITASYPPHQVGGYEIRCKDVIDNLVKRGHEVLVMTNQCPTRDCMLNKSESSIERSLHEKGSNSSVFLQIYKDIKDLSRIDKALGKFEPDIIYLWGIQTLSSAILPYLSSQNTPIVYDEGGSGLLYLAKIHKRGLYFYNNEKEPFIKRWIKRRVNYFANLLSFGLIKPHWAWPQDMHVYFNSSSALEHSREGGIPLENAKVIHSGIDLARFPFRMREQLCSPVNIIVPGRIKPLKGTKDAVHLVKELKKKGVDSRLLLVGQTQVDDYLDEIFRDVKDEGLLNQVEYLPMLSRDELAGYYQRSDICFFASYFKSGFSRVPLEAMASGCVVLTYGNEGSREIIQNGETGLMVPEGDVSMAADLVEGMIANPNNYRKMIQSARLKIEKEHSFVEYVDLIEAYLFATLQRNTKPIQ